MYSTQTTKFIFLYIAFLAMTLSFSGIVFAEKKYSPGEVFSGLEYSNKIIDILLSEKSIGNIQLPISKEKAVKPMHVYELHIAVLRELYKYSLKNNRRPPPQPVSTPINYTPTDVYFLTQSIMNTVESIHQDQVGKVRASLKKNEKKSPSEVYQELFKFYYKISRLNNNKKITPTEVYSYIYRAKEDLQYTLRTLSKRLPDTNEDKKRLLVTAIYGMHSDGTSLSSFEKEKKPSHVIEKAFEVRDKLNILRKKNNLPQIDRPKTSDYQLIKPIDVFLQTQFITAELNLLKIQLNLHSTTNNAKEFSNKTPSDVFHIMKHIDYMLERLIKVMYSS